MATVTKPGPKFTQKPRDFLRVAEFLRDGTARGVAEHYTRPSKVYALPGFSPTRLSRSKHGGGAVYDVDLMLLAAAKAGDGPAAADWIIAHFTGIRETLWGDPLPVRDVFRAETVADGGEHEAEVQYLTQPCTEHAAELVRADEREIAAHTARAAALRRTWMLNGGGQ